jgi:hypothetical protein
LSDFNADTALYILRSDTPDYDELFRCFEGQRIEQDGTDDAEHCGTYANAEADGEDDG